MITRMGKFVLNLHYWKTQNTFCFRGRLWPLTPDQGLCRWTSLGVLPPILCY